jgi:hypothetical protein
VNQAAFFQAIHACQDKFRKSLLDSVEWFTHQTPCSNFLSIQNSGLHIGGKNKSICPQVIKNLFGENSGNFLCLRPFGAPPGTMSSGWGPFLTLAIHKTNLPEIISLDWSNTAINGPMNRITSFTEIGRQAAGIDFCSGSIICYDNIHVKHLKIRTVDCSEHPEGWPSISKKGIEIHCE